MPADGSVEFPLDSRNIASDNRSSDVDRRDIAIAMHPAFVMRQHFRRCDLQGRSHDIPHHMLAASVAVAPTQSRVRVKTRLAFFIFGDVFHA